MEREIRIPIPSTSLLAIRHSSLPKFERRAELVQIHLGALLPASRLEKDDPKNV